MDQNAYNRLRSQVDFLESLLAVLVIALFVLAISGAPDFAVITLAVIIGGGLLNLYRQHQLLEGYTCPQCRNTPHHKVDERAGDYHDPATASCLHCGERLTD
ncbi:MULTISPECIES: hypothetical protein [unclassified Pseudomonas]|uniref:hypothetical protein n=1 Tax=unclassified Pseudomonas TaxID=196821 RepID=UPI0004874933|nr:MULTISPECIES: hypothetical protein [unclassified Pseudomonas]PZW69859.1 hypothetical protein F471_01189 [Pseudomonas sp. URMO17WK12:I1]